MNVNTQYILTNNIIIFTHNINVLKTLNNL